MHQLNGSDLLLFLIQKKYLGVSNLKEVVILNFLLSEGFLRDLLWGGRWAESKWFFVVLGIQTIEIVFFLLITFALMQK